MRKYGLALIIIIFLSVNLNSMVIGSQIKSIRSIGTIFYPSPILDESLYHGMAVSVRENMVEEDFNRIKQWGLNSILFTVWWTADVELSENEPGIYDEIILDQLEIKINLAMSYELKPFISSRVCYNQENSPSWAGWSGVLGHSYVNLNQEDASGSFGRERYANFLQMLALRFPNVGISLWHYPYHHTSPNTNELTTLHEITLPYLYNQVRAVTYASIIINPALQGLTGSWSEGLSTGFYAEAESYGWPFTDDPNLLYGFSNHDKKDNFDVLCLGEEWNYDYNRVDDHYQPLADFKNKFNVSFVSVESHSMDIHYIASGRPILQSRLDLAEAHFQKMAELGLGWFYWRYERPPAVSSPIEEDGSDNVVALLISTYA